MSDEVRRLSALMITDMVGYTRLSQRNEALALRLLDEHNRLIRDSVLSHGGREVKHTGDGFLLEFPSALQAVSCSIDIQRRLYDRNDHSSEPEKFNVRIGLHVGDVVDRGGDVFGDGVNIASRIEPLAAPGGVCLSQTVQAQVWNKIDRPLESLGTKELKNIDLPMEVFRIVLPWEEKPKKREREILDRKRLAVLPLVNISQDPEDAYFADGMTEELIYTLAKIQDLRVIAQTSVMSYRGTSKTIREIGHELKVGTILEGSVRKAENRLRITIQLIDVQSEEHLWVDRYDRDLADVFEIQSEISIEVAKGLKMLLKATHATEAVKRPTDRLDAYMEYLKGRHLWSRRTRSGLLGALKHFERAIEADPKFAKAYSGLADTYTVLANQGHEPSEAMLPKARETAKKALKLDPNLTEAHASLGIVYLEFKHDVVAAEKEFRKAIELNPSYATAQHWQALALHGQLRFEEAFDFAVKAVELDPHAHIIQVAAGRILGELGRHEEAKSYLRRAAELEPDYEDTPSDIAEEEMALWNWCGAENILDKELKRNPNNTSALASKAGLQMVLEQHAEALFSMKKALAIAPDSFTFRGRWARFCYFLGQYDEAIKIHEELYRERPHDPLNPLMLAMAQVTMGRYEDALLWAHRAETAQEIVMPKYLFWFSIVRGLIAAAQGDEEEVQVYLAKISAYTTVINRHSAQAMICFELGDTDRAYEHLDEALSTHDPLLKEFIIDPAIAVHKSDPRFQRILEVMGLAKVAKTE